VCITVIVDNQAGVDAFGELDFCLLGNAAALLITNFADRLRTLSVRTLIATI
jgi:hypothetical protein